MREKLLAVLFLSFIAIVLSLPQQSKSKRPTTVFKVFNHRFLRYSVSHFFEIADRKIKFFNKIFQQPATGGLLLPDNATLIRDNIVDTFSCENRVYGYYADVENECQVFHVCLPQTRNSIRWSFICPAETVFNQVN